MRRVWGLNIAAIQLNREHWWRASQTPPFYSNHKPPEFTGRTFTTKITMIEPEQFMNFRTELELDSNQQSPFELNLN